MSYFATCGGVPVVGGSLFVPLVGAWTADLYLATGTQVSGAVSVVIGNLTLAGFVYRSEPYGGQTRARLVGGYGGWRTTIPDQGYGSNAGVKLSHVLKDAAAAAGEQINIAADATIGNAFTRIEGPASDVLWQVMSQGLIPAWHIAPSGITQTAAWPATTIGSPFVVTAQRPDEGVVEIASEDYLSWLPGCTFTAPQIVGSYTNGGVTYRFDESGEFRFEVLTGTTDRLLGALTQFVASKVAPTRFYGRYAYTISNPTSTTVDASPKDGALGLPSLQNVPLVGDSISSYTPPSGGDCHIMFLDGQATKPVCVWTAGNASSINLDGGQQPVARLGDQVQCFLPPTLPISGTVTPGGPFTGVITVVNPISGVVTGGSTSVNTA